MNPLRRQPTQLGATIIEFALVGWLFFLIMWGIFEFSRAFYVVNTVQHLTRCMARQAVVTLPSEYDGAKQACLIGAGHRWPFFNLTPDDLTGAFHVSYQACTGGFGPNGNCLSTTPEDEGTNHIDDGSYDNQAFECGTQTHLCIVEVTVTFDGTNPPAFGLLAAWMGASNNYRFAPASTTMPAESMGFNPGG